MDHIDRKICEVLQQDGRASSAAIGEATGLSPSSANERVRRLAATGVIAAWRAALDPRRVGAGLCGFVLIDMEFDGESEAVEALRARAEVQELHHISGAHSYLAKIRVADMPAFQAFLNQALKPLKAVRRTETLFALDSLKETSEMKIAGPDGAR